MPRTRPLTVPRVPVSRHHGLSQLNLRQTVTAFVLAGVQVAGLSIPPALSPLKEVYSTVLTKPWDPRMWGVVPNHKYRIMREGDPNLERTPCAHNRQLAAATSTHQAQRCQASWRGQSRKPNVAGLLPGPRCNLTALVLISVHLAYHKIPAQDPLGHISAGCPELCLKNMQGCPGRLADFGKKHHPTQRSGSCRGA